MVALKRRSTVSFQVQVKKVHLPEGPLGLKFEGTPPVIKDIEEGSPLSGNLSVGQVVHSALIPKCIDSESLDGKDLESLLNEFTDKEGKELSIKLDNSKYEYVGRCSKVFVPKGTMDEMGLQFEKTDPIVKSVDEDSPLVRMIKPGQIVYQFTRVLATTGETKVLDIQSIELLEEILEETSIERHRAILVQNIDFETYQKEKKKKAAIKAAGILLIVPVVYFLANNFETKFSTSM